MCDAEEPFVLGEHMRVEPIPHDEQLARVPERPWISTVHPNVLSAATHALVIDGLGVPVERLGLGSVLNAAQFAEEAELEHAIGALRIACDAPIGYAQMYLRPLGWARLIACDLPPVDGEMQVRRYPPAFEQGAWRRTPDGVTVEQLRTAVDVLAALRTASSRLQLAARRLGQAQLRDNEDDEVLDACIALEAALGDDGTSEMTFKISMRAAALLRESGDPARIRTVVSNLYSWRSAIVHGGDTARARRKMVTDGDLDEADAHLLATLIARQAVRALLLHSELAKGKDIDKLLLQGLSSPPSSTGSVTAEQTG